MRSAVIEGLSEFRTKCQRELQEEVERELADFHQGSKFNLRQELLDETQGLLRVTEFDDVSHLKPRRVDAVLERYQAALLGQLEYMTALSEDPFSPQARINERIHGNITTAKLKMVRRGILHKMRIRVQLGVMWPDTFEPVGVRVATSDRDTVASAWQVEPDEVHYDMPA